MPLYRQRAGDKLTDVRPDTWFLLDSHARTYTTPEQQ